MRLSQINPTKTEAMPRTTLASLVAAVAEDPKAVAVGVKASVRRSQKDGNNCMMGGWTS
ncbi:hypothetical protein [Streptomyces antimycoticus]|uniref:hypothetical protein n=1 Tax=Streptomyces antimycoticus TaxID=68175 RepID=UPI001374EFAC|nr:hypothetical protein [Streptomyces antimycoticus]WTA82304.1 hypothetical protein OG751_21735 [Streptomyces antimycoticus]